MFQNFALPGPSMEGLHESLEQLSGGVETSTGEFFRGSYKMCDCDWNQSVIDQPVDGFFTHTGGVNLVRDFCLLVFGNSNYFEHKGVFQNCTYSNEIFNA